MRTISSTCGTMYVSAFLQTRAARSEIAPASLKIVSTPAGFSATESGIV